MSRVKSDSLIIRARTEAVELRYSLLKYDFDAERDERRQHVYVVAASRVPAWAGSAERWASRPLRDVCAYEDNEAPRLPTTTPGYEFRVRCHSDKDEENPAKRYTWAAIIWSDTAGQRMCVPLRDAGEARAAVRAVARAANAATTAGAPSATVPARAPSRYP